MKNSAEQLTRAYIHENRKLITGNVAEHLLTFAENAEGGYLDYLSEEEIHEYETNADMRAHHEECVVNFIFEKFNFDISEFSY